MDYDSDNAVFTDSELDKTPSSDRPEIIAYAGDDRRSTKRTVVKLSNKNGRGAPRTQYLHKLWTFRFEAFQKETLRQDPEQPFDHNDMMRFFDAMLPKMDLVNSKLGPNCYTITSAIGILIPYGAFKWPATKFRWGQHKAERLTQWLEDRIQAGQITRGMWKKRTWIGFAVLSRLVRTYLARSLDHGTTTWDFPVAKCLSVTLISSLSCWSGDVALSLQYKDTFLKYSAIELYLDGPEPTFNNLCGEVTLDFEKGNKMTLNACRIVQWRPLRGVHNSHMCPIAWLLIYCPRHGLVASTTLQGILETAASQDDRCVVWLFPNYPVLAAFTTGGASRIRLGEPATTGQILGTIKEIGLAAGMVNWAYTHALRNGAARDAGHLSLRVTDGTGQATDAVRQSLGHGLKSMASGLTDDYTGGLSLAVYNAQSKMTAEPKGRAVRFESTTKNGTGPEARGRTAEVLTKPSLLLSFPAAPTSDRSRRLPLAVKDANVQPAPAPSSKIAIISATLASMRSRYPDIDPALLDQGEFAELAEEVLAAAAQDLEDTVFVLSAAEHDSDDLMANA
ncbi:hypothetical protein LTR87_010535 [Friedmanniomyces endolithicus]|nr:hypothetical protein LTR87_010535 [Friedmanniomyces endolithicus]